MKDKFYRFMQGRYGVDQFAKFTMGVALVSIVLAIFVNTGSSAGSLLDFFQEYFQKSTGESEVLVSYCQAASETEQRKESDETEKGLSYLYLSFLRSESQDSKRKRKDRDQLSKVSQQIRKEELICSDILW